MFKKKKREIFTTLGMNGGGIFFCTRSSQLIEEKKLCSLISFWNKNKKKLEKYICLKESCDIF